VTLSERAVIQQKRMSGLNVRSVGVARVTLAIGGLEEPGGMKATDLQCKPHQTAFKHTLRQPVALFFPS